MKYLFLCAAILMSAAITDSAQAIEPAKFRHDVNCTLKAVAFKMKVTLKADKPAPPVFVESKTPLKQFQDAIEPQWGMRPEAFVNAYIVAKNEIYLTDNSAYYKKVNRFVDDSLAHELAHYIQVVYRNDELGDDALEMEAIDVQTWYRETFMFPNVTPCPN